MPENALPDAAHREALTAFFFWTSWAARPTGPASEHHLHQQLAARAAGRQQADHGRVRLVGGQRRPAARRHRRAGLVSRRDQRATSRMPSCPSDRSAGGLDADAVDAARPASTSSSVIGAVPARRSASARHRALRGRGPGLLRPAARRVPALRGHPHLAHAARRLLDRHRLAGDRPLRRAGCLAATSRKFQRLGVNLLFGALLDRRGRLDRRRWLGDAAEARPRRRTSGSATRATSTSISAASGRSCLFVGLLLWLVLVRPRAVAGAAAADGDSRAPGRALFLSTVAIGLFYGAGLIWGQHTHLSMWSTGAGGSSTSGSRASSRCSPPRVIALLFVKHGPGAAPATRDRAVLVRDHHLPGRRHPRHVAPPLLHRHADRR